MGLANLHMFFFFELNPDAIAEEEVGTLEMYSLEMGSEVLWFDLAKRP